jgi:SAM-dependent methyltransferase
MLDIARDRISVSTVRFQQADAQELPFDDCSFDLVVCQFGSMFFPDKVLGHSEARRVLREGGNYLLAIWDSIERNEASAVAQRVLIDLFPEDPPLFLCEGPFGYSDPKRIDGDLRDAGFANVEIDTVQLRSRSPTAREAASALCYGTPMSVELEEREPGSLDRAFEQVERSLLAFEGPTGFDALLSAHIVTATR